MARFLRPTVFGALLMMAGCASPTKHTRKSPPPPAEIPLSVQRAAYEKKLEKIQPGMTRHQLYKLFPPHGPVENKEPYLWSDAPLSYAPYHETYALDDHFSILAEFRLVDYRRYLDRRAEAHRATLAARSSHPQDTLVINPQAITVYHFSQENSPDKHDLLIGRPQLIEKDDRSFINPTLGSEEDAATPPKASP